VFVTDVHIPESIAKLLEERGYDVHRGCLVFQPGATDETIAAFAAVHSAVVISCDRGFGDLRRFPTGSFPGAVVLRPASQGIPSLLRLFRDFLAVMDVAACRGRVTVVEPGRIRRYPVQDDE
jgi:predicted nuclease of predicted toxin-antitoxin system